MENQGYKRIERILLIIFLVLGVIVIAGIILIIRFDKEPLEQGEKTETEEESEYEWEDGLADSTIWLPENCSIYDQVLEFDYTDEQGKKHSVRELEGKPVVLIFWASWCSDCKEQLPLMNSFLQIGKQYGDISFVFVNKTDGEKETKETAAYYFKEQGLKGELVFDENGAACETLGIRNIPTMLFLDEEGIITAWSPKPVTSSTQFEALLAKALLGGSHATAEFINNQLTDSRGAVHSSYFPSEEETFQSDILSESQGAMLEYSVAYGNQELFDHILNYIQNSMLIDGLISWVVTEEGASKVNALVDDLRIYEAIYQANESWGGYEDELADYQRRLLHYGINEGSFIDFYDAENKAYARRFTLCYGDLKAMELLAQTDDAFETAREEAVILLQNGQISEEFPLYYSWYNYEKKSYEKDDLNMAEAMVTLLHLAEADMLPDNTLLWLKTQMNHSGVKARYTVKGKVVSGYDFDSTAVYALIAMIGAEIDDDTLVSQAVKKMEKMRIDDTALTYNGAFGMEDGSGITSFDQVMPLLAYVRIYGK